MPLSDYPLLKLVGIRVRKIGGDYRFEGIILSAFAKTSGQIRVVAENADGLLFIFSLTQLEEIVAR